MQGVQGKRNLRDGVLVGLKEIKEGICLVDHRLGVIINTLEGTEGENFGGWLVNFLGNIMTAARGAVAKAGQGAGQGQGVGQGQEEVQEGSSSGSSSSSSSSSSSLSSGSDDDDNEGSQGKGDEGKTQTGNWKVVNVYLEEDLGGKKVRVRRYKCLRKGCREMCNSWSACDAHINKKHLKQVYGPCHDQNCGYTNYNRDTFIAHVKKCEKADKHKHKVK